jgi:hypothetical protein
MTNLQKITALVEANKGASFVSISNYTNSVGEISNYVINIKVDRSKYRLFDIDALQNAKFTNDVVSKDNFGNPITLTVDLLESARLLLLARLEANKDVETATVHSLKELETYEYITPAIKVHKVTQAVYFYGERISKKVLVAAEYKPTNSRITTYAQNYVAKFLELKSNNYTMFKATNMDSIKLYGNEFKLV